MLFYVYVIHSEEGYRYSGHTPDLPRRLAEHNSGASHSTKHGHNWQIIHLEEFTTRSEAMKREKWFKTGVGREWLNKNVAGWSPPPRVVGSHIVIFLGKLRCFDNIRTPKSRPRRIQPAPSNHH